MDATSEPLRIDKWLWAARMVKTRALAAEAVKGGRVKINGERVKPSKDVRAGDLLEITVGQVRRSVVVLATADRRGPASQAALLYEETVESRAARERYAAESRLAWASGAQTTGARPTKRDRRRFDAARNSRRGQR